MADLKLDFLVIPTYSTFMMTIADASTYPAAPPVVSPTMEINIPGFGLVSIPFTINQLNVYSSGTLGITAPGEDILPLPDGIYTIKYSVAPAYENFITKTIMRVDQLQERFDSAFMKLDMMECDLAIKKQQKIDLDSVYYFIQGAIAAANNCAVDTANKLYAQASKMLNNFVKNNCGC